MARYVASTLCAPRPKRYTKRNAQERPVVMTSPDIYVRSGWKLSLKIPVVTVPFTWMNGICFYQAMCCLANVCDCLNTLYDRFPIIFFQLQFAVVSCDDAAGLLLSTTMTGTCSKLAFSERMVYLGFTGWIFPVSTPEINNKGHELVNQTNTCRFATHSSEAIEAFWNSVRHTRWFQEHPVLSSSESLIDDGIVWWG